MARLTDPPRIGVSAASTRPERDRSIDVAKGIAIILIVAGHVWRGLAGARIVDGRSNLFEEVDTALYAVHLPVFALLAGLFVHRGVERRGAGPYLARRALDLAWLYVLWTVIQGGVRLLTSTVTNHPTDLGGFVRSFWIKDSQLWFLPFVVVVTALAVAVRPWQSQVRAALTSAATVIVAVLCWGRELPWIGLAGVQLLPFFWAGVLLTADGFPRVWRRVPWVTVALTTLLATGAALWVSDPATTTYARGPITVSSVAAGVVAAVAGTALVLSVTVGISGHRLSAALAGVGERSLEIFLAHIVATAGTRVALVAAGVHDLVPHLLLGLLAGLVFPIGLWWLGERLGIKGLFARPRRQTPLVERRQSSR